MTKPLALVFYENLLPGSQLVNRLQDLDYRVQVLGDPDRLLAVAEAERALIVVMEFGAKKEDLPGLLRRFRDHPGTAHIPVIAYIASQDKQDPAVAQAAGATLVASATAVLGQLPQLLEQALAVD